MKSLRTSRYCRNRRFFPSRRDPYSSSVMLLVSGYLVGCVIGCAVAINADSYGMCNQLQVLVADSDADLFTIFCGCASYGVGMLLFATSYLGFLFIPGVFAVKGFFSTSVFTSCICGQFPHGLERACIFLLFPGLFLLPAMLILGRRCMHWSVRLFRCRAGELIPPDAGASRTLAAAFVLMLMASAMKSYVVPFVLGLI